MSQLNIRTDKLTNFIVSDGKNINNGATGKTKLFQRKKIMKFDTLVQKL